MTDRIRSGADAKFLQAYDKMHEVKFVNQRNFSDKQIELFERVRANVISVLKKLQLPEAVTRIKSFDAQKSAFICDRITYKGRDAHLRGTHYQGRLFLTSADEADLSHEIPHELLHHAFQGDKDDRMVIDVEGEQYVRSVSGSRIALRSLDGLRGSYFFGWNEGLIETLAQQAGAPEIAAHPYNPFCYFLQIVIRGLAANSKQYGEIDPESLRRTWRAIAKDSLNQSFSFLKDIERIYGAGSAKLLAQFGNERDFDLGIIEHFHPRPLRNDMSLQDGIVRMVYPREGVTNPIEEELQSMQKELFDAFK